MPKTGRTPAGQRELADLKSRITRYQRYAGPLPDVTEPMERAAKTLGLRDVARETAVQQGGRIGRPPEGPPSLPPEPKPRRRPPRVTPAELRGRGQVRLAYDDPVQDYYYHYSPTRNAPGIQESGLDPRLMKGESAGVHFLPDPNAYPAIGDEPMNVYRVRRDAAEFVPRGEGDVYATRRFLPSEVEAYESPMEGSLAGRWSRLGGLAGGARGLYDVLSAFTGGRLPMIQTPGDWILNDVLMNFPNSPYNRPRNPSLSYTPSGGVIA